MTAAGPRCHCGTPITHTPGKVPRVYCSDRCRKAAKRALARANGNPGHLGKETTEFRSPSRPAETSAGVDARRRGDAGEPERGAPLSGDGSRTADDRRSDAARLRRAGRYAARRTLWRITGDRACRGCGRTVMDPETGVVFARTSAGAAIALGLLKCGRIWFCPVCSAKIRHSRAEEITRAVTSWIKRGGAAYLVTFAPRHTAADQLADLMDAIQGTRADKEAGIKRQPGAYQRLITGAAWAGDKRRAANPEGIRGRIGFVGMIRATEITLGEGAGWHPHIHAIVLVGGRTTGAGRDRQITGVNTPDPAALEEWESHWRAVWTRSLQRIDPGYRPTDKCAIPGCKCAGKGHGVDFKRLETVQDAEDLSEYLAKTQDGKDPANELARGDLKQGRHGNMTPFQLLGRIGDLMGGVPEEEADGHGSLDWGLARWAEYEGAAGGRRAIEWSRGLRQLLGLDGGDTAEDDLDALFEMDGSHEFRDAVQITERTWHKVTGRALDLAVIEAVEGDQLDHQAVTELAVAAGSVAGSVRLLTPDQVTAAYEGVLTTLAQRRQAAADRRAQAEKEHDQEDEQPTP